MIPPYVSNPLTGKSRTREFLVAFLETYNGAADDRPRPIFEQIFSTVPLPRQPLYEYGHRDSTKNYVGRASKLSSSRNPNEELWCILADVSTACKQLDNRQKRALGYRYVDGYADITIAGLLNVSETTAGTIIDQGIERLTQILDHTE